MKIVEIIRRDINAAKPLDWFTMREHDREPIHFSGAGAANTFERLYRSLGYSVIRTAEQKGEFLNEKSNHRL